MDFPFSINSIFTTNLSKVTNSLVPTNYAGDRSKLGQCVTRMTEILDEMGVASAKAQDLKKAITSGEKLRNSDHIVYFLTDEQGNGGQGSVVGLLKVGYKKLYLFNSGDCHEVDSLCLLDFYIHESKQRVGCGKILYEFMLKEENIKPQYLAIDRPSEKLIHFLFKHYGLSRMIPQSNHYVVYEEFFKNHQNIAPKKKGSIAATAKMVASSPATFVYNGDTNGCNGLQAETYGRHAASKPKCSMGNILHNPTVEPMQKTSVPTVTSERQCGLEDVDSASGPSSLLDDEALTKNLFLHSRLW